VSGSDLAEMPGHLIRRLHQRSTAVFQERMRAAGHDVTSVQFAALDTLRRFPGIDQATLAQMIAYDRATIGGVVKRLEQKGFIERPVAKEDRRARTLRLTTAGDAALSALAPVVRDLQAAILDRLTDSERGFFIELAVKSLAEGDDTPPSSPGGRHAED